MKCTEGQGPYGGLRYHERATEYCDSAPLTAFTANGAQTLVWLVPRTPIVLHRISQTTI